MQKNNCVCEGPLTKQEFADILNRLREATELVDKVEELLTRQVFYKVQEKAGNKRELKKLLSELLDFDSLHTQKDCLHMYHQLMGIERYLLAVSEDENVRSLLNQVELAKKEIGEGIYQRKR